jgi:hypothetical protein
LLILIPGSTCRCQRANQREVIANRLWLAICNECALERFVASKIPRALLVDPIERASVAQDKHQWEFFENWN